MYSNVLIQSLEESPGSAPQASTPVAKTARQPSELHPYAHRVLTDLQGRLPWEIEFLQSVEEVLESVSVVLEQNPQYEAQGILERIIEPERVISFRVAWVDDNNEVHVNRGYRVQFNNALGPYKGGTRFHSSVTLGSLKFLAFEQTFKNALTGKDLNWGGSIMRSEATGYGVAYFVEEMLRGRHESLDGKTVAVSGFGNVAWGAVQKVTDLGGKVVTLSGPDGFIYDPDGVSGDKIEFMRLMRLMGRDEV